MMQPNLVGHLVSLGAIWALAVIIPGPNFLAIFQAAAFQSRKHAFATAMGSACGTAVWGAAGVFGLSWLFRLVPLSLLVIRFAGAGFLIYAGFMLWRSAGEQSKLERADDGQTLKKAFRVGLLTTLANPKTMAFAGSLFSVSVPDGAPRWFPGVVLMMILTISLSWSIMLSVMASSRVFATRYARLQKPLKKIAGVLFMGFGLRLAISRR